MSTVIQGLIFGWRKNLDYGKRLVADLSDAQMAAQPTLPNNVVMNHPAWCLCHLNIYVPIISDLIEGRDFPDPKTHKFGMQSKPESDSSRYPKKAEIVDAFVSGHEQVLTQLNSATDQIFELDVQLPRWKEIMPKVGIALPYLMLLHENQHLGQISAWRRAMGLPSV
jgi:DinB superfamily